MPWHTWREEDEDGEFFVESYAYVPGESWRGQITTNDWPQVDAGPEYWMWKEERDLERKLDEETHDGDRD